MPPNEDLGDYGPERLIHRQEIPIMVSASDLCRHDQDQTRAGYFDAEKRIKMFLTVFRHYAILIACK